LSKLTKVEELREKLVEPFDADVECQRLFYRGKQVKRGIHWSVILLSVTLKYRRYRGI